ncbi:MAG TPA: hypothetical protein VG826_05940 [Pirellulales bacterium]|nr:hypothetical protein [Pirellulales bacterium]
MPRLQFALKTMLWALWAICALALVAKWTAFAMGHSDRRLEATADAILFLWLLALNVIIWRGIRMR